MTAEEMKNANFDKIADMLWETDSACAACLFLTECPRGVVCYGGEPIFPPCAEREAKDYLNAEIAISTLKDLGVV